MQEHNLWSHISTWDLVLNYVTSLDLSFPQGDFVLCLHVLFCHWAIKYLGWKIWSLPIMGSLRILVQFPRLMPKRHFTLNVSKANPDLPLPYHPYTRSSQSVPHLSIHYIFSIVQSQSPGSHSWFFFFPTSNPPETPLLFKIWPLLTISLLQSWAPAQIIIVAT